MNVSGPSICDYDRVTIIRRLVDQAEMVKRRKTTFLMEWEYDGSIFAL